MEDEKIGQLELCFYSPLVLSLVGNLVVGLVFPSMCPSVHLDQYPSKVSIAMNLFTVGMMMGYDRGMMPILSRC